MEFPDLDAIYRDPIFDHHREPRNRDRLTDPDLSAKAVNPFCGDEAELEIRLDDEGRVSEVAAQAVGCSINQAAASMLSETIKGLSLDDVGALDGLFRKMMQGEEAPDEELDRLGEMRSLAGVRAFPVRIKCALLAWSAVEDAIADRAAAEKA